MSKSLNFVQHLIDLTDKGELTWSYKKETDEYCSYDLDNHVLATYNNTGGITLTTDHPGASGFSLNIDLSNHHNVRQELDESLMKYQDKIIDEHIDLTKVFNMSKPEQVKQSTDVNAINLKLHPDLDKLFDTLSKTALSMYNFRPSWFLFHNGDMSATISVAIPIDTVNKVVIYYDYVSQVKRHAIATFYEDGRIHKLDYCHELVSFDAVYISELVSKLRRHFNPQFQQPSSNPQAFTNPQSMSYQTYEPVLPPHRMQFANRPSFNPFHAQQPTKQPQPYPYTKPVDRPHFMSANPFEDTSAKQPTTNAPDKPGRWDSKD